MSASLWGCELKWYTRKCYKTVQCRQPPCEAVSWNIEDRVQYINEPTSASLWGCELKYIGSGEWIVFLSVSLLVRLWVEITKIDPALIQSAVSLLVRLWVEITLNAQRYKPFVSSASLWGCELKYIMIPYSDINFLVSLLVRLWVEIKIAYSNQV